MHSVHLFTQFKILHDTLSRLPQDQQSALDRAVLGGGWIRDTNGNLLSELQVVALPATGGTREVTHVALPWPDSGTLALARSAVQAQLLVCEVAARSPRGDLFICEPWRPATSVVGGKGSGAQRHARPKPLDSILSKT